MLQSNEAEEGILMSGYQLIALSDPNREILWWGELAVAHLDLST
jgi:hypothetical protein